MRGRLLPAGGGPASHISIEEVVKAAQAKAHRDISLQLLRQTMSTMVKQAEGETGAALRSTLADVSPALAYEDAQEVANTEVEDFGTSPPTDVPSVPPAKGLGTSWAPVRADQASTGLHEDQEKLSSVLQVLFGSRMSGMDELEKQAYLRRILAAGRGAAERMAAKGGVRGRIGRLLKREVRSPIQVSRAGSGGVNVRARSPLAPASAPTRPAAGGAPYRSPGRQPPPIPADAVPDMTRHAKTVTKPKGLVRSLLPAALMLGAGYGAYKGIPAAVNWASQASSAPMAYNFGQQQYQYGYTPGGQAQF